MNLTNLTQIWPELMTRPTQLNLTQIWTLRSQPDPNLDPSCHPNPTHFFNPEDLTHPSWVPIWVQPKKLGRVWPHYLLLIHCFGHLIVWWQWILKNSKKLKTLKVFYTYYECIALVIWSSSDNEFQKFQKSLKLYKCFILITHALHGHLIVRWQWI